MLLEGQPAPPPSAQLHQPHPLSQWARMLIVSLALLMIPLLLGILWATRNWGKPLVIVAEIVQAPPVSVQYEELPASPTPPPRVARQSPGLPGFPTPTGPWILPAPGRPARLPSSPVPGQRRNS